MKKCLFILTLILFPNMVHSVDISNPRTKFEEVDSTPSARYPLLKFPNGTLEDHTTYFIFVASNTPGFGGSGGGGGDNLGNHIATQTLDMSNFSLSNASSVQVNSNVRIGSNTFPAIVTVSTPNGTGVVMVYISSDGISKLFELGSSTLTVTASTSIFTGFMSIYSTMNLSMPLQIGNGNDVPASVGPIQVYINNLGTVKVVARDSTNNTEAFFQVTSGAGSVGTAINLEFDVRVNNANEIVCTSGQTEIENALMVNSPGTLTSPSIRSESDTDSGINFSGTGATTELFIQANAIKLAEFQPSSSSFNTTVFFTTRAASTGLTEPVVIISSGGKDSERVFEVGESSTVARSTFNVTQGGLQINSAPIFYTTATTVDTNMTFMRLFTSTVNANSILTVNASDIAGCPSIVSPMSLSIYNSAAVAAGGLEIGAYDFRNTSIPIINRDLTDAKAFMLWVLCK